MYIPPDLVPAQHARLLDGPSGFVLCVDAVYGVAVVDIPFTTRPAIKTAFRTVVAGTGQWGNHLIEHGAGASSLQETDLQRFLPFAGVRGGLVRRCALLRSFPIFA